MDTIDKGRYADTNKAFQRPLKNEIDYLVEDQNGELHSEVIAREILAENKRFDENKPTTQMLGRFQPFHDGHKALFKEILKRTGQVIIMIRDTSGTDDSNPFDFETVKQNIEDNLKEYKGKFEVIKVPNITNVCYGRGVGWKVEQIELSKEIEEISATKIRKKMGI